MKNESVSANHEDLATVGQVIDPPVIASRSSPGGATFGRRSFVKRLAIGGAMLAPLGAALAADNKDNRKSSSRNISERDADILRFLAAAEIIETDLWQQYADFVLVDSPYTDALEAIDDDMPTYTVQNTNDEFAGR